MASESSWRERLRRFWHTEDSRMAVLRDVLVAAVIVGLLLAIIWGYTGQPFPRQAPVVSVESGSMMHGPYLSGVKGQSSGWDRPGFSRIGTIDPGDIVFVKRIHEWDGVEPAFGPGKRSGYGAHGDVLVYKPYGNSKQTAVIHRAMLYVQVEPEDCQPNLNCKYTVPAACGPDFASYAREADTQKYCDGTTDPITLHLQRGALRLDLDEFPCRVAGAGGCPTFHSGFITKGDNNALADQVAGISNTVRVDWVIGKARGEVPWFGLIKLALYGNPSYESDRAGGLGLFTTCKAASDPTGGSNRKVLFACAPWDIWLALFLALGALISIPVVVDIVANRLRGRKEEPPKEEGPPPEAPKT